MQVQSPTRTPIRVWKLVHNKGLGCGMSLSNICGRGCKTHPLGPLTGQAFLGRRKSTKNGVMQEYIHIHNSLGQAPGFCCWWTKYARFSMRIQWGLQVRAQWRYCEECKKKASCKRLRRCTLSSQINNLKFAFSWQGFRVLGFKDDIGLFLWYVLMHLWFMP